MIYIYDADYNLKTPTTYDKLIELTGSTYKSLTSCKSQKKKIPKLNNCYIVDDKTSLSQLRCFYEQVKYRNEVWKDIKGTRYKISNYGRIKNMMYKNHPEGKFVIPYPKAKRYGSRLFVKINGKEKPVHRLVAEYFVENPNNYPCVYHKNGLVHDNFHANLEYTTHKKAAQIGGKVRYIDKPSIIVKNEYTGEIIGEYKTSREVEKHLGVNRQTVLDQLNGTYKTTIYGYKFEYEKE